MAIVSDLPPDVLDLILARLPLRDAARSSVLSVAWGQSWRHLSDLDFTSSTCDRAAIDAVLLGHSGSVRHARLKVTDGLLPGVPAWVDALSEKMLQSFNLNFNAPSVPSVLMEGQVPKSMFACGALKDLVLTRGVLSAVPASLTGFPSLTNLCLTCSSFEKGSDLEAMPQKLEVLQMRAIRIAAHGWHELRMESSSLRFLEIQGHGNIKWVATRLPRVAHVNFNHAHRDSAAKYSSRHGSFRGEARVQLLFPGASIILQKFAETKSSNEFQQCSRHLINYLLPQQCSKPDSVGGSGRYSRIS